MANDSAWGKSVQAFFAAPENKDVFGNCPFRPHLARLKDLNAADAHHILPHMLGHIVDYRVGQGSAPQRHGGVRGIAQDDLEGELRFVYNDLNNQKLNNARREHPGAQPQDDPEYQGVGPEQRNCCGADARAELIAEAIRAYLQNPDYLKTVAPNVAARIRAAVNANPGLSQVIQFN